MIDGIIRSGNRAVATCIQRLELKIDIDFFASLNRSENVLSIFFLEFATVKIDAVLRIDRIAVLFQQPVHAVRRASFFVGGLSESQIAVRQIAFLLQADGLRDE